MDPLTGYCFGGIMLNVDDDITTRFPWRRGHAGREIPAERARARDHLCPDSWIWYPPLFPLSEWIPPKGRRFPPLPTLPPSPPKTACRTAVSNSRTCTSTVKPAMFRIGNPPRLQAASKSAVSSKTATETMTPCTCAPARKWPRPKAANSASRPRRTATIRSTSGSPPHKARNTDGP